MSRHRADDDARAPWQEGTREGLAAAGLELTWTRDLVLRTLREDLGPQWRDVTTFATIPAEHTSVAHIVARASGVVAGLQLLTVVLAEAAARLGAPVPTAELRVEDGTHVDVGDVLAVINGPTRVILVAERTALNLISRTSGVATHTRTWSSRLEGSGARVLDTRKTTPGLRALEKYAVRCGGGTNKRMGLFDVAMIKDNHKLASGSLTAAYRSVHATYPDVEIQVEVTSPEEAEEAVAAGARFLLCDNMSADVLAETVRRARAATPEPVELEATGGLTLESARAYAETGVQYLSVGALTHSSPALDIALDLVMDQAAARSASFTQVWERVAAEAGGGEPGAAGTAAAAGAAGATSPDAAEGAAEGDAEAAAELAGEAVVPPAAEPAIQPAAERGGDAVVQPATQATGADAGAAGRGDRDDGSGTEPGVSASPAP
jgi:nicotinate-nucleotide pyrophosphorylase (carboxylating)